jgi:arylformamidase
VTPQTTDWIDVSVTVKHGMPHWPDNPPIVLERMMDLGRGDDCNVSRLAMGVHSGTHMDGPVHFLHEAAGLDQMPLTATMGPARVIQIKHPREITAGEISPQARRRPNAAPELLARRQEGRGRRRSSAG